MKNSDGTPKYVEIYPSDILSKLSEEVKDPTSDEVRSLIDELVALMVMTGGIGIAANQGGSPLDVCVCWLNDRTHEDITPMINLKIVESGGKQLCGMEGCLSLPGVEGLITRSEWVQIQYLNTDGETVNTLLHGLNARIVQHEYDHLCGKTIKDRFTSVDRVKNRKKIDNLLMAKGILPKRLKKKGYVLKRKS